MNKADWLNSTIERSCPLCNGQETQLISDKMQHGLNLTTVICKKCGMVYTNPVPTETIYNRFYSEVYASCYGHIATNAPLTSQQSEPSYVTSIFSTIENFQPIDALRLIEVGPGKGQFLFWAKQRGADVIGIEPSIEFHNVLTEQGLPSILGTLEDRASELESGTYNCIFMSHVFEHFYDVNRVLHICRNLLAENGLIVIIVPNILYPYRSLDHYFLRYVHLSNFSPATLAALLSKHGFKVEVSKNQGDEYWHKPHNLFVIARKVASSESEPILPTQSPQEVVNRLIRYRLTWNFLQGPRWHIWHTFQQIKRHIYRILRFVKRQLQERLSI